MALLMHLPDTTSISISYRQCQSPSKISPYVNPRNVQFFKLSKDRRRDRVRVYSRIKDLEVTVPNLGQNMKPCATTTPVKESREDEEKQNYYVNTGDAIRTLREEIPEIFYRELSFNIYRDDIVFKDPLNTFHGIENYKSIFWALRFNGKIFFKALWVDIVSVWQPVENMILIRWTIHGIPRVPWESRGRFDATSEYRLDKNGKIYEHRVHNIALNGPPKFHVLSMDELIQSIGCSSTPKPTCFEISSSSSSDKTLLHCQRDIPVSLITCLPFSDLRLRHQPGNSLQLLSSKSFGPSFAIVIKLLKVYCYPWCSRQIAYEVD